MLTFQVFQMLVRRWVVRAFGQEAADNRAERTHRFLEEALELAQATDCTQEQAHLLVEYVYGRPVGKAPQEVGGTLLTLAALCASRDFDMGTCAAGELMRVNRPEMLERIRVKQEAKKRDIPLGSPLPGADMLFHSEACARWTRGDIGMVYSSDTPCTCSTAHVVAPVTPGSEKRGGTNPAPTTAKPDFNPPGQGLR